MTVCDRTDCEESRRGARSPDEGVLREVERRALGSDFGADGYTTRREADEMGRLLELSPGDRLLDVGAGQGWPGLYLAGKSGCSVVFSDVPIEALQLGMRRARRRRIAPANPVVTDGARLALRPASFDAVVHSDVLCCLHPKGAVLRATRRVLRPGGRTVFTAISAAPGLSRAARRRAALAGPPASIVRTSYPSLLRSAGFVGIDERDVTPEYLAVARGKRDAFERLAVELTDVLGEQEFAELQVKRRLAIAAIEDGLLRRALFMAHRRPAGPPQRSTSPTITSASLIGAACS